MGTLLLYDKICGPICTFDVAQVIMFHKQFYSIDIAIRDI
jgi:hypothetical protein